MKRKYHLVPLDFSEFEHRSFIAGKKNRKETSVELEHV